MTWVACAMSEGDRRAADEGIVETPTPGIQARLVALDRAAYRQYYETISNRVLWFLQHYMWDAVGGPSIDARSYQAWESGYVPANEALARSIVSCAEAAGDERPTVMVQDYQLYLAPTTIRRLVPGCTLQHFTHIPWPTVRYWRLLPAAWRTEICRGLAACDIVGFQSRSDVLSFLNCCAEFLPNARVDHTRAEVKVDGRFVRARAYPISIDPTALRRIARSADARRHAERLRADPDVKTIVRVDRLEPSKNIVRGFDAFELLLRRRRDLRGRVRFLAFLVPSRENVPEYRRYREEILQRVKAINRRYGEPIQIFYENNYTQAVAAMTEYDVLLVNPLFDGMNLVAKEGPIVNRRDGVLVLSEGAGAYTQLADGVVSVTAVDVEGTARALEQALEMGDAERAERATILREAVEREDLAGWMSRQLEDLARLPRRRGSARVARGRRQDAPSGDGASARGRGRAATT